MRIFDRLAGRVKCRLCSKTVPGRNARVVIKEIPSAGAIPDTAPIAPALFLGEDATYILLGKLGIRLRSFVDIKGGVHVCSDCVHERLLPAAEAYLNELDPKDHFDEARIPVINELLKSLSGEQP